MAYGLACPCIVIPAFTFIILGAWLLVTVLQRTVRTLRDRIAARRRLPQLRFHSPPSFMVSPKRLAAYNESIVDLLKGSTS